MLCCIWCIVVRFWSGKLLCKVVRWWEAWCPEITRKAVNRKRVVDKCICFYCLVKRSLCLHSRSKPLRQGCLSRGLVVVLVALVCLHPAGGKAGAVYGVESRKGM